ncbi:MAG TPA: DUF1080 domain-containing protein [Candidatus Acidoferrum sp.]|jgi:hypothetical protein|nr:DUF1080 domain-containing protein [Candidatus Acidoferrum sp.]
MNYCSKSFTAHWWVNLASLILATACPLVVNQNAGAAPQAAFAGRWDLTIRDSNGKQLPSWLDLTVEDGAWNASFVGRWGNARPLPTVEIKSDSLHFVSPRQEEDSQTDLVFDGKLANEILTGLAKGPNGTPWTWSGKRAPALKPPATLNWGEPVTLFNGRDFAGWTFDNPVKASSWVVEKGCLVNKSPGSNIATERRFQNFKLHLEVNCPTNANSGIYLRGRYEVQVEDDSIQEPPSHHMGAIYGFLAPVPEQPRRPGVWQSFDITLVGRFVTVVQNSQTIINNREIPGITGGALDSHEELPGPLYLQGDHGGIAYRNIVLTPATP